MNEQAANSDLIDLAAEIVSAYVSNNSVPSSDLPNLIASTLRQVEAGLTPEQIEALVSAVAGELDVDEETPFWALVDEVSRLRDLGESELDLVGDILRVVAEHRAHRGRARFR